MVLAPATKQQQKIVPGPARQTSETTLPQKVPTGKLFAGFRRVEESKEVAASSSKQARNPVASSDAVDRETAANSQRVSTTTDASDARHASLVS